MPVPKKRMSNTRTGKRRSHHAIRNVESLSHGISHRLSKFFARMNESKPSKNPTK